MNDSKQNGKDKPSIDEIQECIRFLESLTEKPELLTSIPEKERIALMIVAGKISRPDRNEIRIRNKTIKHSRRKEVVASEKKARALTGIRLARTATVFKAPLQIADQTDIWKSENAPELASPRNCYICKKEYTRLHFFYDAMCVECGDLNYKKRYQTASLYGQVALITGARLKIGYQATLMLLRAGATVIATTRFPVDAALRFSKEEDFSHWSDRLQIFGLDLRHTPSVELFASYIEQTVDRLDILINNAAQTVRRPPGFYSHMIQSELLEYKDIPKEAAQLLKLHRDCKERLTSFGGENLANEAALPVSWNGKIPGVGIRSSAQLSQIPYSHDNSFELETVFPEGQLDADLQQVDLRKTNSWRLKLGEIQTSEMLEVQLVNAVAPFVLCNRLVGIMRRENTGQKHIVNVSAMEGKFHRFKKEDRHPHTNMAKAALNMLTHTSASDFAKDGIYMNAVDTGWVTDEDPIELSQRKQDLHDFQPPLDIVDGAARVCDPFFDGILTGKHWCGKFLKDYFPIDW
ncbi:SDR family NAD(P)-dependent oxidoreductase [Leptospira yasudae]|uniref:Oxidoreductase n=1 Tax=Leptospira yasudae TaxID=2202201 RepID=A0ABX9LXN6_9LEPT|nr:SDR family oxidoreductase [Leptospira yasudae]RHX77628.1 oxidoreductase [Leptospira yasudae]TGK26173.1 SDR family oxidoreductase [Leptospira yasudae]TGM08580.1 SDR family oxidoreductase [Leptospira yasudae]TGM97968.1 SDR family oxidoreductase [Leptospira yasudae]